jgi:hypothetical protein
MTRATTVPTVASALPNLRAALHDVSRPAHAHAAVLALAQSIARELAEPVYLADCSASATCAIADSHYRAMLTAMLPHVLNMSADYSAAAVAEECDRLD